MNTMKRKILILCTLLVLSAAILGTAVALKQSSRAADAAGVTKTVTISATFKYTPATLTIKAGTTVVWKNSSTSAHTVTGTGFNSPTINPGATYKHTFTKKGTYAYHCVFHPYMKGTVVVQ
jgi:plastocyanin